MKYRQFRGCAIMKFNNLYFPIASELSTAIGRCRTAFIGVGIFSGLISILALTSSLYMLQLYDRVIPSHNVPTLVGLSIMMLVLYAGYGVLDMVRIRIMSRIGLRLDRALRERVFKLLLMLPVRTKSQGDGLAPVRDLDQVRSFLAGAGPIALFDMPWMPFYLGLVFLLHPWLGLLGSAGAIVLIGLTILTELRSRAPTRAASQSGSLRHTLGEAARRNAEAVHALGMVSRLSAVWAGVNERHLTDQIGASDVAAIYGTASKVLRLVLQSSVLGLGAYLVVIGQATGGVMIAASILVSRALAPVEIAIANWRGFLAARQSMERLTRLLAMLPDRDDRMPLPPPSKCLRVEGLWIAAPGLQHPIVQNVSFALDKGAGLGVIGPSASGKSTLARALVSAWVPLRGTIRLDGATLDQWSSDALGAHIGYLPQNIELFDGSVAENVARFDPAATADSIIAAAKVAGVHDMILRLPEGYETRIGEGGAALSAGQRQRVALARALYGDPFLVVLDEPNSNLDAEGDAALANAIGSVRARGGIAIVIAHRPSALAGLDQLLVMANGQAQAFGPKDDVLRAALQPVASAPATRFKVTQGGV
jgi:PrtD family type I secretion system ABC transporter